MEVYVCFSWWRCISFSFRLVFLLSFIVLSTPPFLWPSMSHFIRKIMPPNYNTCYPFFLFLFIVALLLLLKTLAACSPSSLQLKYWNYLWWFQHPWSCLNQNSAHSSSTSLNNIHRSVTIHTLWHTLNSCHPKMFHFWHCKAHYPIL